MKTTETKQQGEATAEAAKILVDDEFEQPQPEDFQRIKSALAALDAVRAGKAVQS